MFSEIPSVNSPAFNPCISDAMDACPTLPHPADGIAFTVFIGTPSAAGLLGMCMWRGVPVPAGPLNGRLHGRKRFCAASCSPAGAQASKEQPSAKAPRPALQQDA